ncbi:hypothetical protein [Haloarcula sp. H-GB5]
MDLAAIRWRGQQFAGSTPSADVDIDAYGLVFSDEMAVIAEVLYDLGHRKINYGDELTLAVTGRADRLEEWLALHPDVRPVLSLIAHLRGTTLERLTDGAESVRYQPPKSVVLEIDPDPMTTQTSLVNSAN